MQIRLCFLLLLIGLGFCAGCKFNSEDQVTIKGNLGNAPGIQLYLYQILSVSKPLIDSVQTDASGNFSLSFPVKSAGYYTLSKDKDNEITLVISPGEDITISGDAMALQNTYKVKGSKDSELYAEYNEFTTSNLKKVDSLSAVFAESRTNQDFITIKNNLDSTYMQIFNDQKMKVTGFVNDHLHSLASLLVIIENFGPNPLLSVVTQPELFLKLDSTLMLSYPENSLVNTFHVRMLGIKAEMTDSKEHGKTLKPGMPSPEIRLRNADGKEITLSSLNGKLTLIYFWSSWNALCRQANLNLTSIYTQYHDRGFEIYAVSIDSDTELWKKAYMLDKAYWIQLNDPKGLESEYCKTYAVKAIPKMILIGKDGTIIAHDPLIRELKTLIKENL
jgi:peroxiredoxin